MEFISKVDSNIDFYDICPSPNINDDVKYIPTKIQFKDINSSLKQNRSIFAEYRNKSKKYLFFTTDKINRKCMTIYLQPSDNIERVYEILDDIYLDCGYKWLFDEYESQHPMVTGFFC